MMGTNFLYWNKSVEIMLGAKSKLGFVDGTYEKPEVDRRIMNNGGRLIT